jgi:hypothetical protein
LADAAEHLEKLVSEMSGETVVGEEEFAIDLGHVYAHLNRVWNSRNSTKGLSREDWDETTKYPIDLVPLG